MSFIWSGELFFKESGVLNSDNYIFLKWIKDFGVTEFTY